MATLESIELLLGTATALLHDARAQLGELKLDGPEARVHAALLEALAAQREIAGSIPPPRGWVPIQDRAASNQLLAISLQETSSLELAGESVQAIALLERFLDTETDPRYRALVTAEIERIRIAPAQSEDEPDGPLTADEQAMVDALTPAQIARIDQALLAATAPRFRKVAMVVGTALSGLAAELPQIIDLYYAQRVAHLVATGQLEAQGDLGRMRFSEVRLPRGAPGR